VDKKRCATAHNVCGNVCVVFAVLFVDAVCINNADVTDEAALGVVVPLQYSEYYCQDHRCLKRYQPLTQVVHLYLW